MTPLVIVAKIVASALVLLAEGRLLWTIPEPLDRVEGFLFAAATVLAITVGLVAIFGVWTR